MPKKIPKGKQSISIELWTDNSYEAKKRYHSHLTVYIEESKDISELLDEIVKNMRNTKTTIKIRNKESTKTISLPFGAAFLKREIERISREF